MKQPGMHAARRQGIQRRSAGFTLIEMLGALAVGTMMVVGVTVLVNDSIEDAKGQQTALYQSQVSKAATKYINSNYASLLSSATATAPAVIDVATLKSAQLLSTNFKPTNAYGQTPCVLVLQPAAGRLEALMVTEGGTPIPVKDVAYIASLAGEGSGHIPAATPAVAQGAFKSWSVPINDFVSRTCSGTAAGANHLATALFFDGPGNVSFDYLYRNAVPGRPELNRMNTPLHMNAKATENASDSLCVAGDTSTYGRIAVDNTGKVLSCQNGVWRAQGSAYWKDPVLTFAELPASGNNVGDVRMVTAPANGTARAFSWNGTGWVALAVDENGNMTLLGTLAANHLQVNKTETVDGACSPDGRIAKNAAGLLLSCQSGKWATQAASELAYTEKGSVVILKSDFRTYPAGTVFYTGPITYNAGDDWLFSEIVRPVMPKKDGLLIVNVSSLMDRELVTDPTVKAQFNIIVSAIDLDTGAVIASSLAMSPIFVNDTVGVSTTLSKVVPKNVNGYSVKIATNWSVYKGSQAAAMYHRSNYRDTFGRIIEQTPLETSWTLDLTY